MPRDAFDGTTLALTAEAVGQAEAMLEAARAAVTPNSGQRATHGLAWLATYVEALRQMQGWAERLLAADGYGATEDAVLRIAFGEYLGQMAGGLPMSQGEILRPADMGIDAAGLDGGAAMRLRRDGNTAGRRAALAAALRDGSGNATLEASGLDGELEMIRDQFRRWVQDRVAPDAHGWHLRDELIPDAVVSEMSEMGVFGLTIPEAHGGLGLSKSAMCVVSEELSRGYIGVGSLGTRSEIAAELILAGGTDAQKARWLPRIASGDTLPTAVFTEPDTGSDLGGLRTRAAQSEAGWSVTGAKTWITHAARADLMTVLARTDPASTDHKGLSMFLAPKTAGTCAAPFPDDALSGGEIEVLGYRGMKEYTLTFDGYEVAPDALLGGVEGQGFKQLMKTFESARIQTAARAVGVAQNALDRALSYAKDRTQFGRPLADFPRVVRQARRDDGGRDHAVARQLTYFSARAKDADRRCDLEAGMAKLLAARVAWVCADNARADPRRQRLRPGIPEVSRILCDSPHPQHLRGRGGDPGGGHRPPLDGLGRYRWTSGGRPPSAARGDPGGGHRPPLDGLGRYRRRSGGRPPSAARGDPGGGRRPAPDGLGRGPRATAPDQPPGPALPRHMRNTPNRVSSTGALAAARSDSAITSRDLRGSTMPSSQSRAEA